MMELQMSCQTNEQQLRRSRMRRWQVGMEGIIILMKSHRCLVRRADSLQETQEEENRGRTWFKTMGAF